MKVIVMVDDNKLSRLEPLVFVSMEALERYYDSVGWEKGDDFKLMTDQLHTGSDFADATTYTGWVDVQGVSNNEGLGVAQWAASRVLHLTQLDGNVPRIFDSLETFRWYFEQHEWRHETPIVDVLRVLEEFPACVGDEFIVEWVEITKRPVVAPEVVKTCPPDCDHKYNKACALSCYDPDE